MSMDVHRRKEMLEVLIKEVRNPSKGSDWNNISKENLAKILEFYNHLVGKGISHGRVIKFLYNLKTISKILGKSYEEADKKDIERVLATVRTMKNPKTGDIFRPNTIKDYKVVLKVFYRWLRGYPKKSYPPEVDWYSCTISKNEEVIKEILKREDIVKLIESITDIKYKAFFAIMYETAMRPDECLSIVWNDVQDVPKGKMIAVHGKTGARVLYAFWSAKYLVSYMNTHPNTVTDKPDPNMPLWLGRAKQGKVVPLTYISINKFFHRIVESNNIQLKVNPSPYILRRTRLTELLRVFPEAIVKLIAGHSKASNTLGKYYNALTSDDVYDALAQYHGIKVKRTIEKERSDLTECPVCSAQVTPDQTYCIKCMTPLKMEYAEKMKKLQKEYDDFISNPKNKDMIMRFIAFIHKEKHNRG